MTHVKGEGRSAVPLSMSPGDTWKWLLAEKERWARVIKTAAFKLE